MFETDHGDYGFKEITRALASNKSLPLERLEIKKVSFTNTAVDYLIKFITNTKTLYISLIECTVDAERLLNLICAMNQKPTLQVIIEALKCSINSDNDAKCFSQLLSDYPDIGNSTTLDEVIRSVTGIGAVYLAQVFHHNHTFNFCVSSIGDDGAVALAEALHHNSTLNSLYLHHNNIGDAGAIALAEAFHHNSTLNTLELNGNNIGDAGAVALAEALHHNSTLKYLNLYRNNDNFGEKGTHQLVQALTVNKSIDILTLPFTCEKYAQQCQHYDLVKKKLRFL